MVEPIDRSSPPAPAAAPSGYRGRSPASWFSAVQTLVSELSRSPRGECVGQFYARPAPPRKAFSHIPPVAPQVHRTTPPSPPHPPHFHRFSTAPVDNLALGGRAVRSASEERPSRPPAPLAASSGNSVVAYGAAVAAVSWQLRGPGKRTVARRRRPSSGLVSRRLLRNLLNPRWSPRWLRRDEVPSRNHPPGGRAATSASEERPSRPPHLCSRSSGK
jgi:hypothetical protein